nr:hypothetical protein [Gordonia neofelifaecis]
MIDGSARRSTRIWCADGVDAPDHLSDGSAQPLDGLRVDREVAVEQYALADRQTDRLDALVTAVSKLRYVAARVRRVGHGRRQLAERTDGRIEKGRWEVSAVDVE